MDLHTDKTSAEIRNFVGLGGALTGAFVIADSFLRITDYTEVGAFGTCVFAAYYILIAARTGKQAATGFGVLLLIAGVWWLRNPFYATDFDGPPLGIWNLPGLVTMVVAVVLVGASALDKTPGKPWGGGKTAQ